LFYQQIRELGAAKPQSALALPLHVHPCTGEDVHLHLRQAHGHQLLHEGWAVGGRTSAPSGGGWLSHGLAQHIEQFNEKVSFGDYMRRYAINKPT
jgi:hypothetical protein